MGDECGESELQAVRREYHSQNHLRRSRRGTASECMRGKGSLEGYTGRVKANWVDSSRRLDVLIPPLRLDGSQLRGNACSGSASSLISSLQHLERLKSAAEAAIMRKYLAQSNIVGTIPRSRYLLLFL